ncbi:MAG: hypothetical protein RQ885_09785 [Desulfurococcales archaeon]|nr:hypothetical protein [Desulfurococcales archaeon]
MPLGSTATHEPIEITRSLWRRRKSPDATGSKPVDREAKQHQTKEYQRQSTTIGGQAVGTRVSLGLVSLIKPPFLGFTALGIPFHRIHITDSACLWRLLPIVLS